MSGVLLVGLVFNSLFSRFWTDPIVTLIIAVVEEGREAWRRTLLLNHQL